MLQAHMLHGLAEGNTHASHVQATSKSAKFGGAECAVEGLATLGASGNHEKTLSGIFSGMPISMAGN